MGEQYVTPPVVNLENILEQSTPLSPIVFILSPGADPAGDLGKLAEIKGFGGNRFKFLAMGQGQEKVSQPINYNIILYIYIMIIGCTTTFGNCLSTWSLVDVAKLSSSCAMAH